MTDDDHAAEPEPTTGARESTADNGHAISGMTEASIRSTIAHLEALLPERMLTIRELWDRHGLTLPDKPWVGSMASTMKIFLARFGETRVAQFTAAMWEDYRDDPKTREKYCVTTRNIQLRRLKAMMNWAVTTDRIPFNPVDRVKHEMGKPKRETEVSHSDEVEVLKRADPLMRAYILAAVDGAMRRNETRLIEWSHLNVAERTVFLPAANTKSGRARTVRLTPRAIKAIQALPRYPDCPYLFASRHTKLPYDESTLWRRWRAAADDAGLEPAPGDGSVRFHDLRATGATRLSRLGAKVPAIQKILDHRSITTTMLYIRVNAADVEEAYALLAKSQRRGPHRAPRSRAQSASRKKSTA
jgi:integrase